MHTKLHFSLSHSVSSFSLVSETIPCHQDYGTSLKYQKVYLKKVKTVSLPLVTILNVWCEIWFQILVVEASECLDWARGFEATGATKDQWIKQNIYLSKYFIRAVCCEKPKFDILWCDKGTVSASKFCSWSATSISFWLLFYHPVV